MPDIKHILAQLHTLADANALPGMPRFGIHTGGRLGIAFLD